MRKKNDEKTGKSILERITSLAMSEVFKVALLMIAAAAIRLYKLPMEIMGTDEAGYVSAALRDNLVQVIGDAHGRQHPPLYFILYYFWTKMFGISQTALISFSILSGVTSIVVMYYLVKKLFKDENVAFTSGLLACFSLFHFHYSRDATEYAFFFMMICLSLLTFLHFLESAPAHRARNAGVYLLATTALFYTHNYAFMIILVQNMAFFLFLKRHQKLVKWWVIIQILLFLLILPEISFTYGNSIAYGSAVNRPQGIFDYTGALLSQLKEIYAYNTGLPQGLFRHLTGLSQFFISKIVFLFITLLLAVGTACSLVNIRKLCRIENHGKGAYPRLMGLIEKNKAFGITLLILLLAVPLALTAAFPSVYRIKCLIFSVLFYNTVLALGISILPNKKIRALLVMLLLMIGFANIAYSVKSYNFAGMEEDWRSMAGFLKQPEQKSDLIVVSVLYNMAPFFYYYNFSLVDEISKGQYQPFDMDSNALITIPHVWEITPDGRKDSGALDRLNRTLKNVNGLWVVCSTDTAYLYPNREIFNLIEKDFINVSEHRFGSAYAVLYRRI